MTDSDDEFKALVRSFDSEALNAARVSEMYGFPVLEDNRVPPGEVWLLAPLSADEVPAAKLKNIRRAGDAFIFDVELRPPAQVLLGKIVGLAREKK